MIIQTNIGDFQNFHSLYCEMKFSNIDKVTVTASSYIYDFRFHDELTIEEVKSLTTDSLLENVYYD